MRAEIYFGVRGVPMPKGSTRAFIVTDKKGKHRPITTTDCKRVKPWEHAVRTAAQEHAPTQLLTSAIVLIVTFRFLRPKSVSQRKRPYPIVVPDLDKLTRTVLDALTGIIYRDDAQVCEIVTGKHYADWCGVEITVRERL